MGMAVSLGTGCGGAASGKGWLCRPMAGFAALHPGWVLGKFSTSFSISPHSSCSSSLSLSLAG